MPKLDVSGGQIHFDEQGAGPATMVFSHGLLFDNRMFEPQLAHFSGRYRCIAYDHRGQGQSAVPSARTIEIETLFEDAVALIEKTGAAPCHFVGLSMGGFVGLRLAARRPELLRSLILLGTSADPEPEENKPRYRKLNWIAKWFGVGVVVDRVMPILFGQSFLRDPRRAAEKAEYRGRLAALPRSIHKAVNGVIDRRGVFEELDRTQVPTLILVGEEDVATIPLKSERLHRQVARSNLIRLPHCGHTSSLEQPAAVNQAIEQFLVELERQAALRPSSRPATT
ncbi:MAG: alpha/beta fold hydrolase [Alphaproteobacteria bacterium]|nr:alpha/beta fold hydrolase [Alphaproteobacteria bacterium]